MTRQLFDAPMRTYSVGFDSLQVHDESTAAAGMARRFGSRHVTIRLGSSDFQTLATGVADAFPEPAGDAAAMPMLALSSRAREDVKVVLTGEGGDEMFGGYRRYWALPLARLPMARFAGAIGLGQVAQTFGGRRVRQVAESATAEHGEAYLSYLSPTRWDTLLPVAPMATPAHVARAFSRYAVNGGQRPSAKSIRNLELHRHLPESYLEKTDRATMRHGLEARVPFLDLQLALVAMSLTDRQLARRGRTKLLLRSVADRHLPSEVAAGPKRGFSVPLSAWMAPDRTVAWIRESMLGGEATQMGLLDQGVLSQTLTTLGNFGTDAAADLAYRLLALELWCRSCRADQAS
jgi:asparagine synthase (glutamine-hydrolysing)